MTPSTTKTIQGEAVPVLGLGTFELTGPAGEDAIRAAIDIGYRQIDTAIRYGNEVEVGRAIRSSGVARAELFVTTKIWFNDLKPDTVHQRVGESLERLGLDQADLLPDFGGVTATAALRQARREIEECVRALRPPETVS